MTHGFLFKKGKVHGVKYHKEGNYFNHIKDNHILKNTVFSSAEVVSDLGRLCWYRGNPVSNFAFMMLWQHSPLCKGGLSNSYLRKEIRLSSNSFLLKCSLMWIWISTPTSEMFLRKVLQPSFASVFLTQRRRVKQWDWGVFIKKKITRSCHGIAIPSKSRDPCQTACLLVLLLDCILP